VLNTFNVCVVDTIFFVLFMNDIPLLYAEESY
jgi:hypothetical protein